MNSNIRTMTLSVIKSKQGEEYTFPDELYDYLTDLSTLERVNVESNSQVYKHKQYLKNLLVLESNFRVFGSKFLSYDKHDKFLDMLDSMFRDYKSNNLKNDFFNQRKNHYTSLAFPDKSKIR